MPIGWQQTPPLLQEPLAPWYPTSPQFEMPVKQVPEQVLLLPLTHVPAVQTCPLGQLASDVQPEGGGGVLTKHPDVEVYVVSVSVQVCPSLLTEHMALYSLPPP